MKDSALISKICFTHLSVLLVGAVGEAIVVLMMLVAAMVAMTPIATPTRGAPSDASRDDAARDVGARRRLNC